MKHRNSCFASSQVTAGWVALLSFFRAGAFSKAILAKDISVDVSI